MRWESELASVLFMNCKGDDEVDAKRSRPSIGKPAKCHARKERVLLVGTDQRITSGPAAKRLHSKAGYMAAPERNTPQIAVTLFRDRSKLLFAPGRILSGYLLNPGCK